MADDREAAASDFRRMMKWIVLVGVLMVAGALAYIGMFVPLNATIVIATSVGVFFSILLGCGLFAAAFFSDKSGFDQEVTDATRSEREHAHPQISNRGNIQ